MSQNKNRVPQKLLGIFAAVLIAPFTVGATAVSAQEDRAAALEEVIVTAQKREESLQDAPLAITAFTADDMERFGAIEFGDIADLAPNFTLRKQTASHANYAFGVRGVAAGETALAVDSVIGLYLDGVYVGRLTGSAFDIADTERVEVLRGPQGTLYGRNAVGGAINVISNKPGSEFSFRHSFSGGERGFIRNQTTINSKEVSLLGGGLAGRISYARWEHDGILKDASTGQELGDQDSEAWKFALRWAGDSLTVDYAFDRSEKFGNAQLQQITAIRSVGVEMLSGFVTNSEIRPPNAQNAPLELLSTDEDGNPVIDLETFAIYREAAAGGFASDERLGTISVPFAQPETSDVEGHAITLTWDTPWGVTLKSITSYRDWKSAIPELGTDFGGFTYDGTSRLLNVESEWDGTLLQTSPSGDPRVSNVDPGEVVSLFRASRSSEQEQWSQEFQLTGNLFDERLKYVVGAYYFHEEADESNQQFTLLAGAALPFLANVFTHIDVDDLPPGTPEATIAGVQGATYLGLGSGTLCGDPAGQREGVTDVLFVRDENGDVIPDMRGNPMASITIANACFNTSVIGGSPIFNYGTDNDAWAVFMQGEYALTDLLNLTVGVRYTEDEREAYLQYSQIREVTQDAQGNDITTFPITRADDSWSNVTWDVALDYQWRDDINFYGRAASSYRAGGYNARAPSQATFATPFDEEDILSYEVGAKTQWFEDHLRLNITLFRADYEDTQTSVFSPSLAGATSVIENAGEQLNEGVELELLAIPAAGLSFGLNYGYVNAEFEEFPGGAESATVAYAPENTASGWGEYQFPTTDWGQLSVWVGFSYSDGFTISARVPLDDPVNDDTDRSIWDARITLSEIPMGEAPGNLRLALWGRNLGNEEYREFIIPFLTFDAAVYGELRSFGLDLVYEF